MMSPLAVSTYLDSDEIRFDLVIFDEASQIRPHDAICAIYRGDQLVVAGDQKQLPPTNFLTRNGGNDSFDTDEDAEDDLTDYESILDVCFTLGLPRRRLKWHYRSRREPLIAFSNRHFYDNELVTFPGVDDLDGSPSVRFEYLPEGRWLPGRGGGFNRTEAKRTAELVFAHFRENPGQSLGVIAFSRRQQFAVLEELEVMRKDDPTMESFFGESFFVKNLENVQGDERDVIFLSVGYGPDENRSDENRRVVSMKFGPLNHKGGERRLNIAVTRAKSSMTVVSSLKAIDLDLGRARGVGVKLLRAYLDFAERGPGALRSEITSADELDFDSPFEKEVSDALEARGMRVRRQVGCGGFRIDLALADPDRPGRYLLGVECDGATYHSSATARDRDRLRQSVLEGLGWRICRVWSTDWFHDPATQIDRVVAAFAAAKLAADAPAVARDLEPDPVGPPRAGAEIPPPTVRLAPTPSYASIGDVPQTTIRELLLDSLNRFGTTAEADLVKSVTRQLGFQRTGARITSRLSGALEELAVEGKVLRTPGGVRVRTDLNSRSG